MKPLALMLMVGITIGTLQPLRFSTSGHAATSGRYTAFAGHYFLHDGRIVIRPSGWGLFSYGDIDVTCPKGIGSCTLPGYVGNAGKPGPHATFQLTSVEGNVAYGYVLTDSQYAFIGLTMRVVRQPRLPSILLTLPDFTWPGCRLPMPSNYNHAACGA